jgi:hypothetical protein
VLDALLAAFDEADPQRAASRAWPLLAPGAAAQVGDEPGLARLFANDRHLPLLAPAARTLHGWEVRDHAARAELLVTPLHGQPPHVWLVALARGADGRWRISGLQREGFLA